MQWEKASGKKIKVIKETPENKAIREKKHGEKSICSYCGENLSDHNNTKHNINHNNKEKKVVRNKKKQESVNIDKIIKHQLQKINKEKLYISIVNLHFQKKHNNMIYEYKVRVGKCPQSTNYIYEVIIENITNTNAYKQVMNKTLVSTEKSLIDDLLK